MERLWIESRIIAENWRALELQSFIGELSLNASILNSQMNILEYQKSCESILGCSNGWLNGSKCKNGTQNCAVLLADFPGGIINEQIKVLSQAVWWEHVKDSMAMRCYLLCTIE